MNPRFPPTFFSYEKSERNIKQKRKKKRKKEKERNAIKGKREREREREEGEREREREGKESEGERERERENLIQRNVYKAQHNYCYFFSKSIIKSCQLSLNFAK